METIPNMILAGVSNILLTKEKFLDMLRLIKKSLLEDNPTLEP